MDNKTKTAFPAAAEQGPTDCGPALLAQVPRRGAFTLVELLVVIAIIGVLVGLLIPAITVARYRAKQTRIKTELSNLERAIESYKNDVADSYPPTSGVGNGTNSGLTVDQRKKIYRDFKQHLKRAFPRHRESPELISALVGCAPDGTAPPILFREPNDSGGYRDSADWGMTPAEAMVFWLQRFSSDPDYPISGAGGPSYVAGSLEDVSARNWIIDFAEARYGPRDTSDADGDGDPNEFYGRYVEYLDPRDDSVTRRINMWEYYPTNSAVPVAYFDASRSWFDIEHASFPEVFAIKQREESVADASSLTIGDLRLANKGKFQILHSGADDEWGDFGPLYVSPTANPTGSANSVLLFPDGPFTLDIGDTVTNFAEQTSLEDAQP